MPASRAMRNPAAKGVTGFASLSFKGSARAALPAAGKERAPAPYSVAYVTASAECCWRLRRSLLLLAYPPKNSKVGVRSVFVYYAR